MRRLRHLTGHHRTGTSNRVLGLLLAFNAGAVNAGGFLVVNLYTSHMTGFLSMLADNLVLCNLRCSAQFTITAVVALLMLVFGLVGAITLDWRTPFSVPMTVLLLSFIMGLQNATVTKMSSSQIRTTHMTGVVTDLGIELGKLLYWNRTGTALENQVRSNHARLRLFAGLVAMFLIGGIAGAAGFKHVGFVFVVPLALVLLALSLPPLWADRARLRHPLRKAAPAQLPPAP